MDLSYQVCLRLLAVSEIDHRANAMRLELRPTSCRKAIQAFRADERAAANAAAIARREST